jgi:hypothetical protein
MSSDTRYCKDCVKHEYTKRRHICTRNAHAEQCHVTARVRWFDYTTCDAERYSDDPEACGPEGRHYTEDIAIITWQGEGKAAIIEGDIE